MARQPCKLLATGRGSVRLSLDGVMLTSGSSTPEIAVPLIGCDLWMSLMTVHVGIGEVSVLAIESGVLCDPFVVSTVQQRHAICLILQIWRR